VSPLLAVAEELREIDLNVEFLWIGTKDGPEKILAKENKIPFKSIAAGKLRRYFSLSNFLDLFKIKIGFFQSLFILRKFKPDVFVSAGAFVSVPAAIAAYILKIPILIHQQDVITGLANKIMSFLAKRITVSLDISLGDFQENKTEIVGNPVRSFVFLGNKEKVFQKFNLEKDLPIMLVMGGGTGAKVINEMVIKSLPELVKFCQIIHLTGRNKEVAHESARLSRFWRALSCATPRDFERTLSCANPQHNENARYHQIEFATSEIPDFYAAADLVISRAGMSSLSEICALGKPSIIIPIPKSHQEKNAEYFASRGAVKIFKQQSPQFVIPNSFRNLQTLKPRGPSRSGQTGLGQVQGDNVVENFVNLVKELLFNPSEREKLSENAKKIMSRDAGQRLAKIIKNLSKKI